MVNFRSLAPVLIGVSFILALIVPLPGFIIDLILVTLIGVAILIYMQATSINEWHEMKSFPSILILIGIFRVSINVSTTRKILTDGQPGQVIEQFGNFVIGNNVLVGIVVFIVLIIFQFIVANGSSRTAEVAARFTLDAMPNKYMSIDADLQQRVITEKEAVEKRKMLGMEADFYGAMDGAGKFIKGDVVFGTAVVFINIIFGLIVGMVQQGMTFSEAALHYTTLTVGDGLINQIGSLLIAIASGLVITRVFDGSGKNLLQGIYGELMKNGIIVYALGGLFIIMGIFTKLPLIPFVLIGSGCIYLGYRSQKQQEKLKQQQLEEEIQKMDEMTEENEVSEKFGFIKNDYPISIELGLELIPLIEQKINGETAEAKVNFMRKNIAAELGISVPAISFKDNTSLKPKGTYQIKIKGTKIAEGYIKMGHLFALKTPHSYTELDAEPAKDPIFGYDGYWIEESMLSEAKLENYQILEPLGILITHLDISIRKNVHELIQRQQVKDLIDTLEDGNQVLIDEIKKKDVDLSLIQTVIQQLLKEGISIKDLATIIEGIIDGKGIYKNVDDVISLVREKISKQLSAMYMTKEGTLPGILFDEQIERDAKVVVDVHKGYLLSWDYEYEISLMEKLAETVRRARMSDIEPILITRRKDFRFAMLKTLPRYNVELPIMWIDEISSEVIFEKVGIIK